MPRKPRTAPRKSPTQARSRATVDAILEATARLLVKHGFDRTSTNQIAEAAGVSVGSLYQYFPSKDSLVTALMERHMDEMRVLLFAGLERVQALPLPAAVRVMVQLMLRAHAVDPALHKVLMEQVPLMRPRADFEVAVLSALAAFLRARQHEVAVADVELSATLVVATVEAITHGAVLYQPHRLEDDRLVDELTAMISMYLTTPRAAVPVAAGARAA